MTVKELISKLSTFDSDMEVFVRDHGNIAPIYDIKAQDWNFEAYGENTPIQKKVVTL